MAEKYCGYALKFISGKYTGNILPLPANKELYIGRGSDLDIVLVEDMVSRRHAKIITGDDYVILQDLGSTNGSFVNGERVRKVRLKEGDRILIGTSILRLIAYDPDEMPVPDEAASSNEVGPTAPPPLPGIGNSRPTVSPEEPSAPPLSAPPPPNSNGLIPPPLPPQMPTQKNTALAMNSFGHAEPSSAGEFTPGVDTGFQSGPAAPPKLDSSEPSQNGFQPPFSSRETEAPSFPSREQMDSPSLQDFSKPSPAPAPSQLSAPPSRKSIQIPSQPSMTGNLAETPLRELLELFESSGRNGVLAVYHNGREGHIHFRNGNIVSAVLDTTAEIPPKRAALRILSWDSGEFALFPPYDEEIREEINEPPQSLLAEAQRYKEKISQYLREFPTPLNSLTLPHPLQPALRDLRPQYLDIIQLVYNYRNIEDILDASPYSEEDTYKYLLLLFKQGYLQAS